MGYNTNFEQITIRIWSRDQGLPACYNKWTTTQALNRLLSEFSPEIKNYLLATIIGLTTQALNRLLSEFSLEIKDYLLATIIGLQHKL